MRNWNYLLIPAALVALCAGLPSAAQPKPATAPAAGAAAPIPQTPGDHKLKFKTKVDGKPVEMAYALYLPRDYDKTKEPKPLLLFIHGAGEVGTDCNALYIHGPLAQLQGGPESFKQSFPFIVLAPQCPPRGERWDQAVMYKGVVALLDEVARQVRVDKERVYITGLSMGGKGTWLVGMEGGDRVAAIAPICAGTTHPEAAQRLRYTGIWMIAGKDDGDAVNHNNEMLKVLAGNEASVVNTIVPGADHGVWPIFYENAQFYEFLLSHKRPTPEERRQMDGMAPFLSRPSAGPPRQPGHYRLTLPIQIKGEPVGMSTSLYVPKTYHPAGTPTPLLVFLHEYNVIGVPFKDMCLHGPDVELEKKDAAVFASTFPCVVLSPECPAGIAKWDMKETQKGILDMIDQVTKAMNIDKTRVYITGLNEGAAGAWQVAAMSPQTFAAIAPMAPQGGLAFPGSEALKDVPTWAVVSDADKGQVENLAGAFKAFKAAWKLTPVPPVKLEELTSVYKNREFYDWLLKQKKAAAPK